MIGTTSQASWNLDAMNMFPSIKYLDSHRTQIDAALTAKFPTNAKYSILEAIFGADEHVTLALGREMAKAMTIIQNEMKFEPKDEVQKQAQEALVTQAWNQQKPFIKQELYNHLQLGIAQWWDKADDHFMRVDCDDTMNPPSVLEEGKLVAVVTLSSGIKRSELTIFHFVFDRYSTVEAVLKNGIDQFLKDLAASRPNLFAQPYEVICDRTNNSDEDIANNVLNVDLTSSDPEVIKRWQEAGLKPSPKE